MELKLHPDLKEPLQRLCEDPKTTMIVLSGSDRNVLDENFGGYSLWLAAEHGMFLRRTTGDWMTTMPENLNMDWVDSVKHVFEYFTERTPRSHFELRETSLVWNYKYADVEFGNLQSKDLLQHLWTGPVSNASVDVVQGARSVEDEDIYTFFEPELPTGPAPTARAKIANPLNRFGSNSAGVAALCRKAPLPIPSPETRTNSFLGNGNWWSHMRERMTVHEGSGGKITSRARLVENVPVQDIFWDHRARLYRYWMS
ncbi:trehalose-6-phosphate synthase [Perilla frutescens var. hirtella]|uniref:Trehalose-6-phosphate synthase n=1 Tax=Perilla frutescens var. hirtella TaxID=608512 RepID=A0AAD4PD59_PERFH|nr:trehalose-6-phosphate synthase [Perilla frutescens var. hirtella]